MIPFNRPPYTGHEDEYVLAALKNGKLCGDGPFTKKCHDWFEQHLGCRKALLVTSCTHALEMAALLIDIKPGDEVIMPSYTFVSTANAFVLRGAKIVFVDIRPDTMNIDERLIESAITSKTKAIVPVHYAGVACEMDAIMEIANRKKLYVIEDAAQGMMSTYKGKPLGTIGHIGAYSFHETKNYTSGGEGGLLIINDSQFVERAEIVREKGTNRSKFFRGMVDKYSWVDIGSSYLASDIQAAYLYGQLLNAEEINNYRKRVWSTYYNSLLDLNLSGIELPNVVPNVAHNAHMFYLKVKDIAQREKLIAEMKHRDIGAVFHYVPLHDSLCGRLYGRFHGDDNFTTNESERLLRIPLWFGISDEEVKIVIDAIHQCAGEKHKHYKC